MTQASTRQPLSLLLVVSAALTLGACKSAPPELAPDIIREQADGAKTALSEAVDGMLEDLKANNGGAYPRDLRVAFLAEVSPGTYKATQSAFGIGGIGETSYVTGSFEVPSYFRHVRREVERQIKKQTDGALLVYDYEIFGALLKSIGLDSNPMAIVLPENREKLRRASEARGSSPIDAICRVRIIGTQQRPDGPFSEDVTNYVDWDLEVRMVSATPIPTPTVEGSAQVSYFERPRLNEPLKPWIDIGAQVDTGAGLQGQPVPASSSKSGLQSPTGAATQQVNQAIGGVQSSIDSATTLPILGAPESN